VRRCPRCGGRLFIDWDEYGFFWLCINCGYRGEVKGIKTVEMVK